VPGTIHLVRRISYFVRRTSYSCRKGTRLLMSFDSRRGIRAADMDRVDCGSELLSQFNCTRSYRCQMTIGADADEIA